MSIAESLLPEFDHEMASTRKVLERVPYDNPAWKPHEKSMAIAGLAYHVASVAGWGKETFTQDSLDMTSFKPPTPIWKKRSSCAPANSPSRWKSCVRSARSAKR